MAAVAPPAPTTQTTTPPPASITIADHDPNPDFNLYDITFETNTVITTTVTSDPSVVSAWITTLISSPSPPSLFGVDIEWRPNRSKNSDNPVATLQLCTKSPHNNNPLETHVCLIFQIIHCPPPMPAELVALLGSAAVTFVGAGIENDEEKLLVDYELKLGTKIDLGELAKERDLVGLRPVSTIGLKELARVVMGVEVEKPKSVTMGRWDQGWLTTQQIQYACVDAFLSFEIGSRLLASPVNLGSQ